jgi:hypothetical protein
MMFSLNKVLLTLFGKTKRRRHSKRHSRTKRNKSKRYVMRGG